MTIQCWRSGYTLELICSRDCDLMISWNSSLSSVIDVKIYDYLYENFKLVISLHIYFNGIGLVAHHELAKCKWNKSLNGFLIKTSGLNCKVDQFKLNTILLSRSATSPLEPVFCHSLYWDCLSKGTRSQFTGFLFSFGFQWFHSCITIQISQPGRGCSLTGC